MVRVTGEVVDKYHKDTYTDNDNDFGEFSLCSEVPVSLACTTRSERSELYGPIFGWIFSVSHVQLFRERLSGKVHATILKGIVGGFEFSFFQRNLKELARKAMEMCLRVLKESNKSRFDSYSRQEQCIDHIPYYLSGLSRAQFFRQPFSK